MSAQSQTDNTLRTSLIPLRGFLETHKTNTETKKIPAVIKKFPLIWTTGRISSVDHYLVRSERVLVVRCGQTIWRNGCVPRALSHYTHSRGPALVTYTHTHVIISPTPLLARDVITLLFTQRGEHLWRKLIVRAVSQLWWYLRRYVFKFKSEVSLLFKSNQPFSDIFRYLNNLLDDHSWVLTDNTTNWRRQKLIYIL